MFHPSFESLHTDLPTVIATVIVLAILVHLVPYLIDSHRLRSYPGPLVAKFSDAWLGSVGYHGHLSEVVYDLHRKYGPFVRIAPDHISVALSDAEPLVYGHGSGALKSSFYDVFARTSSRSLFDVRDRQAHTRKRKIISHTFSQKSVLEFEPHVRSYVSQLLGRWDKLYDKALKGMSGEEGEGWTGRDGRMWLDYLPWANYLAFDIIGDLTFGAPFGMIAAAKDFALVPKDQHSVLSSYGKVGAKYATKEIEAIKTLTSGAPFVVTAGPLPGWWRPLVKRTPWLWQAGKDFDAIVGMAMVAVAKRLEVPTDRNDFLSKLLAGKDEDGNPMGREEVTAEALNLLIAGSDTTAKSACTIVYLLARTPSVQGKLQKELDEYLGSDVATAEQVKNLPYLQAVINEGLRLYPAVAMGLPRVAPEGGMMILGNHFPAGTVVSVPTYTIHRDPAVFGDDVEEFRPERWFERNSASMSKAFAPFSLGPRACIGRNLANLELQIIIASIFRRFNFVLENPDEKLQVYEGFVVELGPCRVGIKAREVL
ncbi:cytochrome P450 monooxygenase [Desarmillaria tabescens]|uniref:Cytochrome P450 monooxygenase n=1 Tax=Armillaria tabescens TaxID=1929756 RepID=A0AA39NJM9_ARMTA|nr:cytochrome P450 monooxygenase [Desarmillaria tabescens]KAK0466882.1 cytochrome P450 monooxygenase [Desarmillaria tabescens]